MLVVKSLGFERQIEFDAIQAELDAYKHECEKLYNDTMPELIPDYFGEAQATDLNKDQLESWWKLRALVDMHWSWSI